MGIGAILQDLLKDKNSNVNEVSNATGVSPSTLYSIIKRDSMSANIQDLYKVAHYLGVSLDYFYAGVSTEISQTKKAPSISDEAMKIAKRYHNLDSYGKATVRAVMDEEENRIEEQSKLENLLPENEPKIINLFDNPSAAGPALGETGQSCQPYELTPDDPQGASYAIRVQGDSMEPDFLDGSIAFVNHDEMRDGDIGVFCVDGATVIKQYHYDAALGMTYLFSLNRKRSDADLLIPRSSGRALVWQGRVITKRRYPLPGM